MLGKLRVFTSKKLIALLVSFAMCFVVLINTSEVSHAAEGSVRNVATAKYVLSEVRRIRTLFYDDPNVRYNHMSLKDYLSTHNISKEQYVNGIQYDSRWKMWLIVVLWKLFSMGELDILDQMV